MADPSKPHGFLRPLGGGDPIPLIKDELIVGRRPTNDIRLDFENISGKHCQLSYVHGVWHVRDLASSNGTFLNGQRVEHDMTVMPDDELGLATHAYWIDYEPMAPTSLIDANRALEEEMGDEGRKGRSLLELAGLEGAPDRKVRPSRPKSAPDKIERLSADEAEFDDVVPDSFEADHVVNTPSDEEFLDLIRDDVGKVKDEDEDKGKDKGTGKRGSK
jgi:hypothetical protein